MIICLEMVFFYYIRLLKAPIATLSCLYEPPDTRPLIADRASFGNWELPLKFVKTDTGGQYSPGCHKIYNYERKTPGKALEVTKPDAGKTKEK